ncbi:1-phosphofructokinase [Phytopseudomonas dryadis]|uniref:Phosphofructokinase n=1 Tax=Phytopseudomonas dryadis TaxID=2487520 RepID=A0A4Q9QWR5_9GAMM|nr:MULTISPECIES: 1-phosphofructokinase [Pseudomonas]TBU88628.1 1-phosphofructokinase [Pseudomonas dryadis]TBV01646.1 1-phosphofructokinase [Pseudomonas dryadis]TBV14193.1 1-phosphofructokinase [Pseudomonas sp. FRB 230]
MARILTLTLNPALDLTVSLETLRPGAVNRSLGLSSHAAGKGLNVAQVLADLGHKVTVSGFLGTANAAPFELLFDRRGFIDAFVRVPGESRSNIKLAERDGRVTDLNGPGPQVDAAHQAQLLEQVEQIAAGHEAVVVAGSLPPGVELDGFVALLRHLKALGLPLVLDSSGAALRAGLAATPWLIKPNEEELADACGVSPSSPEQLRDAALRLREQGVEHVLLSRGAAGVDWLGPQIALHAQPPSVEVLSTVGAGDSLLAATLHGLLSGWPAERTLRLATAVAAQAVTQLGFGIHDRQQLARLEAAVSVVPA